MVPAPIAPRLVAKSVIKTGDLNKGLGAVTTAVSMKSTIATLATARSRMSRWRKSWAKTAQQESQLPEPPPLLLPPPSRRRQQRPPPSPFSLPMPFPPPSSALIWEDPHPIPNTARNGARYLTKGYAWTFLLLLVAASLSDYRRRKHHSLASLTPSLQELKLDNEEQ